MQREAAQEDFERNANAENHVEMICIIDRETSFGSAASRIGTNTGSQDHRPRIATPDRLGWPL
jgi:hypothetical protein